MAPERGSEKVACDMADGTLCRAGSRLRRTLLADCTQPSTAQALSLDRKKWFGTGLAGKRIFHIGNAMKLWFLEVTVP
jgi:hypothetical protein